MEPGWDCPKRIAERSPSRPWQLRQLRQSILVKDTLGTVAELCGARGGRLTVLADRFEACVQSALQARSFVLVLKTAACSAINSRRSSSISIRSFGFIAFGDGCKKRFNCGAHAGSLGLVARAAYGVLSGALARLGRVSQVNSLRMNLVDRPDGPKCLCGRRNIRILGGIVKVGASMTARSGYFGVETGPN